jgi:hypothetical protein
MTEITKDKAEKLIKALGEKISKPIKLVKTEGAWRFEVSEPLEEEHFKNLEGKISEFVKEQNLEGHVKSPLVSRLKHESGKWKLSVTFRERSSRSY